MYENFQKLIELLSAREQRNFALLVLIMIFEAVIEMIGVGIIPIYILALAYPQKLQQHELTVWLFPDGVPATDQLLIWGSALLLFFFFSKTLISIATTYWKMRFAQTRSLKLSRRLFKAYMNAPYVFHLAHNTSELLRNINTDCSQLANNILSPMISFISHAAILLGIICLLLFTVEPTVLVWLAIFLSAGIGSARWLQRHVKELGHEAQQHRALVVRSVNEGLGGVKEIRLLQRSGFFVDRLVKSLEKTLVIEREVGVVQHTIPTFIEFLSVLGLLGVTIMFVMSGEETEVIIATLSIFAVAMARMKGAVRALMQSHTTISHHSASLNVVYDGLHDLETRQQHSERPSPDELENIPGFSHSICLENLHYRYPKAEDDTLQSVELNISRGEALGFVGSTGAGKSTLLDIILGILEPTQGRVTVDGQDIRHHPIAWQRHLGYIPQTVFLMDGSVRSNIALGYGPKEIDEERLEQAVAAAALGNLMEKMPDGLDSIIGERGIRLSGGERQRIAIARALYHNPDVLVMDEATSALDNTTEAAVIEAVEVLKGDRTILMIAHRLSTVRRCDRIVFLKNGRIDAIGSYDELTRNHAEFRTMAVG